MRTLIIGSILMAVLIPAASPPAVTEQAPSILFETVVLTDGEGGHGSGIPIFCRPQEDGSYLLGVLTAAHVANHIPEGAIDVYPHSELDAAIVTFKVDKRRPVFDISYTPLRPGQRVFGAGYPLTQNLQIFSGYYSRNQWASLAGAPGISGGPVVDTSGRLRGMQLSMFGFEGRFYPSVTHHISMHTLKDWLANYL